MSTRSPARRSWRIAAAVLAAACASACARTDPALAVVERRTSALTLLADGSLQVRETLRVRLLGAPVGEFRHVVDGRRVDLFFDTAAWLDGIPLEDDPGDEARVSVARDGHLDVRWTFPPVADTVREFVVEYRASGAMATEGANGMLEWPLAPIDPPYAVVAAEVRFDVPRGAVFMEPPRVDGEAGWHVEVGERGLQATREGLAPGERATLRARMATDTMAAARPEWQFNEALAAELVPAFLSGGVFMVLVGIGILWMLSAWYPDPSRAAPLPGEPPGAASLPDPLPPAFALALERRRSVRARHTLGATARDLESRGVFDAGVAAPGDRPLLSHEQVLADEVWLSTGAGGGPLEARLHGAGHRYRAALTSDLVGSGLVDAERVSVARGLSVAGWAVVLMGLACAAVVPWLLWRFGVAAYGVPAGVVLLGLMLLGAGRRFVVLTPAGDRVRAGLGQ